MGSHSVSRQTDGSASERQGRHRRGWHTPWGLWLLPSLAVFHCGLVHFAYATEILILSQSDTGFTQTFDALGTGTASVTLPTGWDVRTGATATSLGVAVPSVVKQTWGDNAKGFINTASTTDLASNASTEAQGTSVHRALGVRLASDFGDPGAAFYLNFDSSDALLRSCSIDLLMLSVQGRSTAWALQYGIGIDPTSFTTIANWTDPGTWGTTPIEIGSAELSAMSFQPSVWLRLAASSASTGSGSRDTVAIDTFQLAFVPEPASMALGLSGAICALGRRWRGSWWALRSTALPQTRQRLWGIHRQLHREHTPFSARPFRGFTLVELLVVISITGTLLGMLLPAVQAAREAARRSHCQNNLKQIALGLLGYETSNGRFPPAAIVSEGDNTAACTGCWNPWAEAQLTSVPLAGGKHGTSWLLEILPHIDQTTVFNAWNRQSNVLGNAPTAQTDIPTLYCPSRRSGIRTSKDDHKMLVAAAWRGGGTDYGGCYGRLDGFINDTSNDHRFADRGTSITGSIGKPEGLLLPNSGVAIATARDGLSNTILVGELQRLRPIPAAASAADTYNRTSYDGWAVGGVATLFTTSTDPGHRNPGGMNNLFFESPGSDHSGGASFAMADGSVAWLSEWIDAKDNNAIFPLLGSMRDGQPVGLSGVGN